MAHAVRACQHFWAVCLSVCLPACRLALLPPSLPSPLAFLPNPGLASSLNETTNYTILAPTNQAFDTALASLGLSNASLQDPASKVSGC